MPLDVYAKKVRTKNFWGGEVDLAVVMAQTKKIWQIGKTGVSQSGSEIFIPTLQFTPRAPDFSLPPKQMVHVGGNHFNVWLANVPPLEGIAGKDGVASSEEGESVRHLPACPARARAREASTCLPDATLTFACVANRQTIARSAIALSETAERGSRRAERASGRMARPWFKPLSRLPTTCSNCLTHRRTAVRQAQIRRRGRLRSHAFTSLQRPLGAPIRRRVWRLPSWAKP